MSRFQSHLICCLLTLLLAPWSAAQEAREEPTPFSVWLDFARLAANDWPRTGLPPWLESVVAGSRVETDGAITTTFRFRFRELRELNKEVLFRIFFDDEAEAKPKVSGWAETGTQLFERGPLGQGLGLPTSETLSFPSAALDYVEVNVAGNGRSVRGVFLAILRPHEMRAALDFAPPADLIDAFNNEPPAKPKTDDLNLYGRVKATIDSGVVKLASDAAVRGTWEFDLQSPPLVAMVGFEVLNADGLAPLELILNARPLGPVAMHFPDLADPGYRGLVRPLEADMRFRYTGWLRCFKMIPGSALRAGANRLTVQLHPESGPVAVRSLELQLKHNWEKLDYTLSPSLP